MEFLLKMYRFEELKARSLKETAYRALLFGLVIYCVARATLWFCPVFMALGINQVTYSSRQFCRSVGLSVGLSVLVLLL